MKKCKWSDVAIAEWSYQAFPGLKCAGQHLKLDEELQEAEAEFGRDIERWIEEMADVSIVAAILYRRFRSLTGRVINEYIRSLPEAGRIFQIRDNKMEINTIRKWEIRDGSYLHV